MSMSYCRFQNTLSDLRECAEYMGVSISDEEDEARAELVALCKQIAEESGTHSHAPPVA